LEHYGTLSLEEVLAPAVSLAEQGVMLLPNIRALIRGLRWLFTEEWPTSGAVYLPGGRPPEPGRPFRNPDMARTFRGLIREEREHRHKGRAIGLRAARKAFYQGFVAEAIDAFCRQADIFDMTGERHRAFLAGEDLAAFEATFDTPVSLAYHGHTVHKCGPWSQGPVFLQQLRLLSGFDLPSLGHNTADYIHVMIEAAKLAFADRDVYYGDPGHSQVPLDILLSEPYAAERRGLIDAGRASQEFRPGRIAGFAPNMEFLELARQAAEGRFPPGDPVDEGNWQAYLDEEVAPLGESGGDTVHVDVIDKDGNMVAVTPSGGWFPSSPVVPGLGFPLGTRGQMFWLIDNHPAALAPGRKPRTTLSPSMVTRGDEPYMAFGTPGADQQDQWPLHLLLSHIHFGLDLQQAIEVPGFHSRHFPASFAPRPYAQGAMNVEDRLAPEVVPELERRGHLVNRLPPWVWEAGRELAASIDPDAGVLRAAASPRGYSSYAIGR
jgi:gamma-glutamyltranspeptidase/glutathione hydrolase